MIHKRILLADDREIVRALDGSFFCRSGFSLIPTADGDELLQQVMDKDPVLVVLALGLPGLEGSHCCRQIKEDPLLQHTPILLVAEPGCEAEVEQCRKAGGDAVLWRPVEARTLTETACRLLDIPERDAPRVAVDFPVKFDEDRRLRKRGRACNLSPGGVFLAAETLYPVGTPLRLELGLPGRERGLFCEGRVVWVNHPEWVKTMELPAGMGVAFAPLPESAAAVVGDFLQRSRENHSTSPREGS